MSGFSGYTCQLCKPSYIVNPSYQCMSNPGFNCPIGNCAQCQQSSGATVCKTCLIGYSLSADFLTCTQLSCTITNCQTCNNGTTCTTCIPGYQVSGDLTQCQLQVYQCSIANCLYCKSAGICAMCAPGYSVFLQTQTPPGGTASPVGSSCVAITASSGGSVAVTNCQQYGPMVAGTSGLQIGCINCMPNYINVGGYCVANISQTNYVCNIANCVYCVQNNICGQCLPGFTAFMGSTSSCVANYSPIPNCLLTGLFNPSGTPTCAQCANGYVLVDSVACVAIPANFSCNVTGCNYCLQNNTCSSCTAGYSLSNGTCTALCSVQNCFTCADATNCQTCAYGYYLQNATTCASAANQPASYCNSTFGAACTACTFYACTQCSSGNTLVGTGGQWCCQTPTYNIANCQTYSTSWSANCAATFTCTGCNFGTFLTSSYPQTLDQCTKIPCSIGNCTYCFQNTVCIVCNVGYNLVNNVCTQYTVPSNCTATNCVACNVNGTCTACLNGYLLYNGACVCNFQNCLAC